MQAKWTMLRSLGYTGSINDMEKEFYADNGGTGAHVNDLERTWLASLGFTERHLIDARIAYWTSLGYTGTYNDLEQQFWTSYTPGGGGGGSEFELLTRGGDRLVTRAGDPIIYR
jgi:hypothetical protein